MKVHLDPKIEKHLQALRRSGKKANLAASKVEEIIRRLQHGAVIPGEAGSVTKHGELRIRGVKKYDLGGGYRLITYKEGRRLFLLYAGSHDDCHRWLENNREITAEQIEERCARLPVRECEDQLESVEETGTQLEEEYDPLDGVSQRELRKVFGGLVNGYS